ncbi:jg7003 [Pararge aegeria aegeria]|uniref:Jg7003 protein n=1 Tax=Pararge aegeria aegeria TaxID=348720 RepID=A0A8S4SGE9_9NEOP|nr:jg7003 [Pararge aegeria aegeria]
MSLDFLISMSWPDVCKKPEIGKNTHTQLTQRLRWRWISDVIRTWTTRVTGAFGLNNDKSKSPPTVRLTSNRAESTQEAVLGPRVLGRVGTSSTFLTMSSTPARRRALALAPLPRLRRSNPSGSYLQVSIRKRKRNGNGNGRCMVGPRFPSTSSEENLRIATDEQITIAPVHYDNSDDVDDAWYIIIFFDPEIGSEIEPGIANK